MFEKKQEVRIQINPKTPAEETPKFDISKEKQNFVDNTKHGKIGQPSLNKAGQKQARDASTDPSTKKIQDAHKIIKSKVPKSPENFLKAHSPIREQFTSPTVTSGNSTDRRRYNQAKKCANIEIEDVRPEIPKLKLGKIKGLQKKSQSKAQGGPQKVSPQKTSEEHEKNIPSDYRKPRGHRLPQHPIEKNIEIDQPLPHSRPSERSSSSTPEQFGEPLPKD